MNNNAFRSITMAVVLFVLLFLLSCRQAELEPAAMPDEVDSLLDTTVGDKAETYVTVIEQYDLGETTILQGHFSEDSPFRNMPVRLDGLIGVPESDGQHPVVLIMHGSHASCPGENEWPCSPEEEQKNYEGFDYLVEALAQAGYVALSINVNAEHTFGFGEAPSTVRTKQLIDLHLEELAAANAGDSDKFGPDLSDRVDLARMTWLGHSRGGEFANRILRDQEGGFGGSFEDVQGLIQVAPALVAADSLPTTQQVLATILPACDQDLFTLEGHSYYESARSDVERQTWATSVFLKGANHNNFNSVLEPESEALPENRPDCTADTMLSAEEQQAFLAKYVIDFLDVLYGDPDTAQEAGRTLGIRADEGIPDMILDKQVDINFLPAQDQRLTIIQPEAKYELYRNLLGGDVRLSGLEAVSCPGGYYVPDAAPGTEACKRVNFNQPGYPQQLAISWSTNGAELRTSMPDGFTDFTDFDAIQLRAALDPLSELNEDGEPKTFSLELVDKSGQSARIRLPNLEFPSGIRVLNEFFEGDSYTGHVHMRGLRIPLEDFEGIDLTDVSEVVLIFDETATGAIYLADLELIRAE